MTYANVAGRPLDEPACAPFFEELNRRGTVLFLHPQGVGAGPGSAEKDAEADDTAGRRPRPAAQA